MTGTKGFMLGVILRMEQDLPNAFQKLRIGGVTGGIKHLYSTQPMLSRVRCLLFQRERIIVAYQVLGRGIEQEWLESRGETELDKYICLSCALGSSV